MGNIIIAGNFEDIYATGDISERNENASYPSTNIVNFRSLSKHFRAQDATDDDWLAMINSGTIFADLRPLDQTARSWREMCVAPNGNIYVCVYNGDIYMQTGGKGDFAALGQTTRNWIGMCATPGGNIYACVYGGDIYMQTAGVGNFNALSAGNKNWRAMACSSTDSDVYCCVYGGSIWKQTAGAGAFNDLAQTNRNWAGMAATDDDNIYCSVAAGSIYMQTAGAGDFNDLTQTNRAWRDMDVSPDGDVYAAVDGGDIYKQTAGTGDFVALSQINREWWGTCVASDGTVYVSVSGGDIYTAGTGIQAVVLDDVNFDSIEILGNDTDAWGAPAYDETFSVYQDPRTGRYSIFAELTNFDYDYLRLYIPDGTVRVAAPTVWKMSRLALLPNDLSKTITLSKNISRGYRYNSDIEVNDNKKLSGSKERSGRSTDLKWTGIIPYGRRTTDDEEQLWILNALNRAEPHIFYENQGYTQYAYICWREDMVQVEIENNQTLQYSSIKFEEII